MSVIVKEGLMGKIVCAIITTIIMGYIGIIIGAALNLEGYLGIIFAIATMGAFILNSIESLKTSNDKE